MPCRGWVLNRWSISDCFSSSREKTMTRRARLSSSNRRTSIVPNDPVPPVIRIDLPSRVFTCCAQPVACQMRGAAAASDGFAGRRDQRSACRAARHDHCAASPSVRTVPSSARGQYRTCAVSHADSKGSGNVPSIAGAGVKSIDRTGPRTLRDRAPEDRSGGPAATPRPRDHYGPGHRGSGTRLPIVLIRKIA